mmetsp:Transcript_28034/g.70387  ORF Transcript_28034/g.70387 Transcript_28034/m.70387 type:complete len:235 (-) Transcript_28034:300-1004(-)
MGGTSGQAPSDCGPAPPQCAPSALNRSKPSRKWRSRAAVRSVWLIALRLVMLTMASHAPPTVAMSTLEQSQSVTARPFSASQYGWGNTVQKRGWPLRCDRSTTSPPESILSMGCCDMAAPSLAHSATEPFCELPCCPFLNAVGSCGIFGSDSISSTLPYLCGRNTRCVGVGSSTMRWSGTVCAAPDTLHSACQRPSLASRRISSDSCTIALPEHAQGPHWSVTTTTAAPRTPSL